MKSLKWFAAGACIMLLTACVESESEYHQTYFYPVSMSGTTLYADQDYDSLRVISMDSWTAKATSDEGWFDITPKTFVINSEHMIVSKLMEINAYPNNTGKNRTGVIRLTSFTELGRPMTQLHWLNISVPEPRYGREFAAELGYPADTVLFDLRVPAAGVDTTLLFRTYKEQARLEDLSSWVTADSVVFPTKGRHASRLTIQANPEAEERVDTLRLTSNGVTSLICVRQSAR